MVINTISVQYQVFKATTENQPRKDDSETEGDATDIAKPICTSDEGENKTQSTANLSFLKAVRSSVVLKLMKRLNIPKNLLNTEK